MDNQKKKNSLYIELILKIAMLISLIIWAVIGLIIYIPLVLRMTSYYCGMVVLSAFSFVDLSIVQQRLEYAVHLYPDRFVKIIDSFNRSYSVENQLSNMTPINWNEFLKKATLDILWTIIFWFGFSGLVLYKIQ